MQIAVRCELCPVCFGLGVKDIPNKLPKKRKEFSCDHCQGQCYVPQVTCRGCGRAALEWDAEVPYCGRKECWEKLVEMVDPNKEPGGYRPFGVVIPFGPDNRRLRALPGFVTRDDRRFTNHNGQVWDPFKNDYVDSSGVTTEEQARAMWAADGYMC